MTSKPLGVKNYGSIAHLSFSQLGSGDHFIHEGQEKILTQKTRDQKDIIIVQEKLDGTNVGVCKVNGEIIALQRSGYRADSSPYEQHRHFAQWVRLNYERFDVLLHERERVVGEWIIQACGTIYPLKGESYYKEPFIAFDIMDGTERLTYMNFLDRIIGSNIETPYLFHLGRGIPFTKEDLLKEIDYMKKTESFHVPEGAVYRVERDGKVDFLAKYVRTDHEVGKYLVNKEGKDLEPTWNILPEQLFKNQQNVQKEE